MRYLLETGEDMAALGNKYTVTVELILEAESADDAEEDVKTIIDGGILRLSDEEDREPLYAWNLVSSEPTEIF